MVEAARKRRYTSSRLFRPSSIAVIGGGNGIPLSFKIKSFGSAFGFEAASFFFGTTVIERNPFAGHGVVVRELGFDTEVDVGAIVWENEIELQILAV